MNDNFLRPFMKKIQLTCDTCAKLDANCKKVFNTFAREKLDTGYKYMATVPNGACNLSITLNEGSRNFVALRWTSKHKLFFLNGDWTIQSSGNYTVDGNTFSYTSSNVFKGEKTGDQVQFFTQLTHSLEVYLIVQSRNTGVWINYQLPRQSNEKEIEFNQKNTEEERMSNSAAVKSKHDEYGAIHATESTKERPNSAALSSDETSLVVKKPTWWHHKSQVDSTPHDTSRPKWLDELKDIMNLWREDLADLKASLLEKTKKINDRLLSLEDRASRIETNMNTMKRDIYASLNRIDNTIAAMKATSAENQRKINTHSTEIDSLYQDTHSTCARVKIDQDFVILQ